MSPAEYREWLRQRAVFDDAAFAEYVTVEGQVFPRHLREASRFADAHDQWMVADPGLTAQACRVATSRARPSRFRTGAFDDRVDAMVYAADLNPTSQFYWATGRR